MPAFHFRLEPLLNVKKQLEKSAKNELGIAVQKYERQKKFLMQIQAEIYEQQEEYRREGAAGVTLAKLRQRMEYIRAMHEKEMNQQTIVNEAMKNVDMIREKLIAIMKEKKVLEKLREKELDLYRKEQEKAAQLLVDELVSFKESTKTVDDKA